MIEYTENEKLIANIVR